MTVMHEKITILTPPAIIAGKEVYPVVKISSWCRANGGFISGNPLGLFIRDRDQWYFVKIDEKTPALSELISLLQNS